MLGFADPKGYRMLEHRADIVVEARGGRAEETFARLAMGLFEFIADRDRVKCAREWNLKVEPMGSWEDLLVEFLNELIYLHETERALIGDVAVEISREDLSLRARCRGETYDPSRHGPLREVKAATYHRIVASDEEARVVFDV